MEDWKRTEAHSANDISAIQIIAQEAYVFSAGIGTGIVQEIRKDPLRAAEDLGAASITGAALGLLVAAELPLVSTAALAAGAYCTGKFLADELNPYSDHNRARNRVIADAWRTASFSCGAKELQYRIDELSSKCSRDSFELLEAGVTLAGARVGAELPCSFKTLGFDNAMRMSPVVVEGFRPLFKDVTTFEDFIDFQKSLHGPVRTIRASDALLDIELRNPVATRPAKPPKQLKPESGDAGRPGPSFFFSERSEKHFGKT